MKGLFIFLPPIIMLTIFVFYLLNSGKHVGKTNEKTITIVSKKLELKAVKNSSDSRGLVKAKAVTKLTTIRNFTQKNVTDNSNHTVDVSDLMEKLPNAVFYVRTKPINHSRRCSQTITGRRIAINYASHCCKMAQPR